MSPSSHFRVLLLPVLAFGCGAGPVRTIEPREPAAENDRVAGELVEQGRAAAERGDTVRAEQYFTLAIERGADARAVVPLLVQVCVSGSRLRAALNHAVLYLRANPDEHALRYLVATVFLALGDESSARRELEHLLHQENGAGASHADAHYLLGVLDSASNLESALEHFRTYLDLAPTGQHGPEVRGRLSELLVRRSQNARVANTRTGQGASSPRPTNREVRR